MVITEAKGITPAVFILELFIQKQLVQLVSYVSYIITAR